MQKKMELIEISQKCFTTAVTEIKNKSSSKLELEWGLNIGQGMGIEERIYSLQLYDVIESKVTEKGVPFDVSCLQDFFQKFEAEIGIQNELSKGGKNLHLTEIWAEDQSDAMSLKGIPKSKKILLVYKGAKVRRARGSKAKTSQKA